MSGRDAVAMECLVQSPWSAGEDDRTSVVEGLGPMEVAEDGGRRRPDEVDENRRPTVRRTEDGAVATEDEPELFRVRSWGRKVHWCMYHPLLSHGLIIEL